MKKIIFSLVVITICSCDPIRRVQVTNLSSYTIEIETDFPHRETSAFYRGNFIVKEELNRIREKYGNNLQIDTISKSLSIRLQPYQQFYIANHFGPMSEIEPSDLYYSRLSIYTFTDTITARDKNEIIELFNNPRTMYIKDTDKKHIKIDHKRWRNIVIRD